MQPAIKSLLIGLPYKDTTPHRLFVYRLVGFLCAGVLVSHGVCSNSRNGRRVIRTLLSGDVWLPEKELMQERVDRVWAFHHDHVAAFLDHFQEGK